MVNIPWQQAPSTGAYQAAYAGTGGALAAFLGGALEGGLTMAQLIAKQRMERKQFKLREQALRAQEQYNREMMKFREEGRGMEKERLGISKRGLAIRERGEKEQQAYYKKKELEEKTKEEKINAAKKIWADIQILRDRDQKKEAQKMVDANKWIFRYGVKYKPSAKPKEKKRGFTPKDIQKAKRDVIAWFQLSKDERELEEMRTSGLYGYYQKGMATLRMTPFQKVIDEFKKKYPEGIPDDIMIKIMSYSVEQLEKAGY